MDRKTETLYLLDQKLEHLVRLEPEHFSRLDKNNEYLQENGVRDVFRREHFRKSFNYLLYMLAEQALLFLA